MSRISDIHKTWVKPCNRISGKIRQAEQDLVLIGGENIRSQSEVKVTRYQKFSELLGVTTIKDVWGTNPDIFILVS
jgi:hypothetical protein